jgi:hypothetical protein
VLVYGAIAEHGIDRAIQLFMQQRPSSFTYATTAVINDQTLQPPAIKAKLDAYIAADPDLQNRHYALFTQVRPLPIIGTSGWYGLDFAAQLAEAAVDFSPPGAVTLPPVLSPMQAQRMALQVRVIGGIWFPNLDRLASVAKPPITPLMPDIGLDLAQQQQTVINGTTLLTFDATFSIVLGANLDWSAQPQVVRVAYDGLELTGVVDPALDAIVRAYATVVVQLVVLPRLANLIPTTKRISLPAMPAGIQLNLTYDVSLSTGLPANPAFEDDQAKVFLTAAKVAQP